jgi:hypothetical protein
MAPLLKDASATMEQALDFARRREYERAREKFQDAARKYSKEGSILYVDLANAYAELFSLAVRNSHPGALIDLSTRLRSTLGSTELRPGPRSISAVDLALQLELTARDTNLMGAIQNPSGNAAGLAQALQALANDYRQLGNQVLYIPELFQQRTLQADTRVPVLMALSYETLGRSIQSSDPLAAAEHFQTAQQYWAQAGNEAKAQESATRVGDLALQARCWLCGREGTGHGIQFVSVPISENLAGLKGSETSPLPSVDRSGNYMFVCKGCYAAVRDVADRVSAQRVAEAEQRLLAEMRAMEQRLRSSPRT